MKSTVIALFAAFGLVISFAPSNAHAEDCPRGFLDKGYCDRDNDLVADLPLDQSKWIDPSTIIFS